VVRRLDAGAGFVFQGGGDAAGGGAVGGFQGEGQQDAGRAAPECPEFLLKVVKKCQQDTKSRCESADGEIVRDRIRTGTADKLNRWRDRRSNRIPRRC
jgi:hypothetical protein